MQKCIPGAPLVMLFVFSRSVALFGSAEKASLFLPHAGDSITVVASPSGKLADINTAEVAAKVASFFTVGSALPEPAAA